MNRNTKLSALVLILGASGALAYAAQAAQENDAVAINNAKIPLAQAVSIAEQHAHGKAARAEYEDSNQGWVFDVEVVNGAKVFDVRVDANSGRVISSIEDKEDKDDEHDKKD